MSAEGEAIPSLNPDSDGAGRAPLVRRLLHRLSSLRGQLIIPYVILTVLTAMIGTYVVTRLVTSSVRERFVNQLYEASRVAADGVVRRERTQLRILRLMAFTAGVPEALQAQDGQRLASLLQPVALNASSESVVALNLDGREVVGLTLQSNPAGYKLTSGSDFSGQPIVDKVLAGLADATGDKYVGVIGTAYGPYLYTSAPVDDASGHLVGVLLVGTRLDRLADDLKTESLADIAIQASDGTLMATTFAEAEGGYGPLLLPADQTEGLSSTRLREFDLYGRSYQAAYSPWIVRGQSLGVMGAALPSNFVVAAGATSRNSFSLIFSLATVAVMLMGYWLAQSIARPILRLRSMATAVAGGNLKLSSGLHRADEIGDLAHAFDVMAERLQSRTAEAERLYAEAVERNRQLAEMYERLQAAQRQLVQSEKLAAVGQLAAGIVHDVKNPLGVIKGMAEEMLDSADGAGSTAESFRLIRDNAARANSIVSDLLLFARQSTPTMSRRDLRETVEGSLRLTDYMLRKGRVRVEKELPDQPVLVTYDPQQMQQVLINLIQNAVQAMPDGGELKVRMTKTEESVEIRVTDSGVGIAPENLPRIFEPFFTTKPEGQGTGMGLAVSYGIVGRHGGQMEVESQPGRGTTFTIRLPRTPRPEAAERETAA